MSRIANAGRRPAACASTGRREVQMRQAGSRPVSPVRFACGGFVSVRSFPASRRVHPSTPTSAGGRTSRDGRVYRAISNLPNRPAMKRPVAVAPAASAAGNAAVANHSEELQPWPGSQTRAPSGGADPGNAQGGSQSAAGIPKARCCLSQMLDECAE
jgi:hypothetical protein